MYKCVRSSLARITITCQIYGYSVNGPLLLQGARPAPTPGPAEFLQYGASSAGKVTARTTSGSIPIILSNSNGMQAHILPIGATIQRLIVLNSEGVAEDVVLGYDDPKVYQVPF